MHNSVAAIRAGRLRTRFTIPSSRRREAQLGLRGGSRVPISRTRGRSNNSRPLDAVRQAARGLACAQPSEGSWRLSRRTTLVAWSRPAETGLRRARQRSAAPWRG